MHWTPTPEEIQAGTAPAERRSGDTSRWERRAVLHRVRSGLSGAAPPMDQAASPGAEPVPDRRSTRREAAAGPPAAASSTSCVAALRTSLLSIDIGLSQRRGRRALPYWLWITSRRLEMEREHPDLGSIDGGGRNDFLSPLVLPPRESSRLITSSLESRDLQLRDFFSAVHHSMAIFFSDLLLRSRFQSLLACRWMTRSESALTAADGRIADGRPRYLMTKT